MSAGATSFKGTIASGEDVNGSGAMEKFQTLKLERPACGPDKSPVDELQIYASDTKIHLAPMVGKKVTIDGEPFAAHTAHHHRPIVVDVKRLNAE
jgi:hypothetical protein